MTYFLNKFKKLKKNFQIKFFLALPGTTSHGFLASCQNLKKLKIQFRKNAWIEGRKDGQTVLYKTPAATAGGLIENYFS